jgi:hypothetical protein
MQKLLIGSSLLAISTFAYGNAISQEIDVDVIALPVPIVMKEATNQKAKLNTGTIIDEQIFLSVPYNYSRTAVLKTDIIAKPLFAKKTYVKAGALGYWAGRFTSRMVTTQYGTSRYGAVQQVEIWCFFGKDGRDADGFVCINDSPQETSLLPIYTAPYMVTRFTSSASPMQLERPIIEEKEVEILANPKLDYRLKKISKKYAQFNIEVNGIFMERAGASFDDNGKGEFISPIGVVEFIADVEKNTIKFNYKPQVKTETKVNNVTNTLAPQEKYNNLKFKADMYEASIKRDESRVPRIYNIIDKPEVQSVAKNYPRYSVIAKQNMRPTTGFIQKASPLNRPERFGAAGAKLFEVIYQPDTTTQLAAYLYSMGLDASAFSPKLEKARTLLCWRDYEKLSQELIKPSVFGAIKGHCLEDTDKDNKYETLWKDPTYTTGAIYRLGALSTPTKLVRDDEKPIEVEISDISDLPMETIGLYYVGQNGEKLDENGKFYAESVKFEWHFMSGIGFDRGQGELIRTIEVKIDKTGNGALLDAKGNKIIEISNFKLDGSADIKFNDFYNLGNQSLIDYQAEAQKKRELLVPIKEEMKKLEPLLPPKPPVLLPVDEKPADAATKIVPK